MINLYACVVAIDWRLFSIELPPFPDADYFINKVSDVLDYIHQMFVSIILSQWEMHAFTSRLLVTNLLWFLFLTLAVLNSLILLNNK